MATKPSPIEIAKSIKEAAAKYGFTLEVRGGILTVHKSFPPGSNEGFRDCDMMYYSVLGLLPRTEPGSDWGTDGGGIGGMCALNSGRFKMNRSGGSKRVLAALVKLGA
jgi:hypothetical protein